MSYEADPEESPETLEAEAERLLETGLFSSVTPLTLRTRMIPGKRICKPPGAFASALIWVLSGESDGIRMLYSSKGVRWPSKLSR